MANLDFFAAESDQRAILEFLFTSTDVRIFESHSEFDQELREFRSVDQISSCFAVGVDWFGNGHAILMQLWSPSVTKERSITHFAVNPKACNGHTFRHRINGAALIQLYLGGVHKRMISKSPFGHNTQIRAQKWHMEEAMNWDALKTLSNKIQHHIRNGTFRSNRRHCTTDLGARFSRRKVRALRLIARRCVGSGVLRQAASAI